MKKRFTVRPRSVTAASASSKHPVMAAERDWDIAEKEYDELPKDITPEQFLIWECDRDISADMFLDALLDRVSSDEELLEIIEDFGLTSKYYITRDEW